MHLRYDEERLQALALNLPFVLLYYTAKAIIFYLLTYFTITKNAKLTKKETIS